MTKPGAHLRSAAAPLARGGAEGRRGADAALPERMGATLVRRSIAAVLVACAALTAGGLQRPPRPQPRPRAQLPSSAPPPLSRRTALLGSFATAAGGAVLQPGRARGADDIGGLVWTPVEGSVRKLSGDTQRQRFPLRFSTYLTRFLLEYDRSTRAWWDEGGRSIPLWFDEDAVERVRLTQYGELTRSVEYGLATAYDDPDGADRLLAVLSADFRSVAQARQLAILFSLLPAGDQPVRRLGELLGRADNASVRAVRVREPGRGYDPLDPPNVTISSPLALNGSRALGRALVDETNGTIVGVELLDGGSGYSQARRVTATVDPPPRGADSRRALLEVELPAREERRGVRPSRLPALSKASSLTSLLPDRTPVTYDEGARCYRVGRAGAVAQIEEITPPDGDVDAFGPVNREPVQRSAAVDGSQYARLALAGAVCAALGHAALTPLEVVKTKLQADAARYDGLNFFESVAEVAREPLPVELARTAEEAEPGGAAEPGGDEGPPDALHDDARAAAPAQAAGAPAPAGSAALEPAEPTLRSVCENLFRGVDASALGHFISGGISFGLTEYLRRALAEALGPESALIYPPWAVVSSASVLGVIAGTTAIAPFEATRVRMVRARATTPRHRAAPSSTLDRRRARSSHNARRVLAGDQAWLRARRVRGPDAPLGGGRPRIRVGPQVPHAAAEGHPFRHAQVLCVRRGECGRVRALPLARRVAADVAARLARERLCVRRRRRGLQPPRGHHIHPALRAEEGGRGRGPAEPARCGAQNRGRARCARAVCGRGRTLRLLWPPALDRIPHLRLPARGHARRHRRPAAVP